MPGLGTFPREPGATLPSPRPSLAALLTFALTGCGSQGTSPGGTDPEKVRAADISILFIGNSHTSFHNLPDVVSAMIRHQKPGKTVVVRTLGVGFLEEVTRNPQYKQELEAAPWKYVVLQAQKISVSGKHEYSRQEGIDFAKSAKARGARVFFYSEWGLKNVAGDGARNERIYQAMTDESGADVLRVGRAWDLALADRPELPLHDFDGNHQTALGAFLTACVIAGRITGESPATLANFPYPEGSDADRGFLANTAAKSLTQAPEKK